MGQALYKKSSGKLSNGVNFYLAALDEEMRHPDDQPSIGLILCKEKNRIVVEYWMHILNTWGKSLSTTFMDYRLEKTE